MHQPDELKSDQPLLWSMGTGQEVWSMLFAAYQGDLATIKQLLVREPKLSRCQFQYRTPIYFAVRENNLAVAEHLLRFSTDPLSLAVNDQLVDICQDRGLTEMESVLRDHYRQTYRITPAANVLAHAIKSQPASAIEALLEESPELIEWADETGNHSIHWATMTRRLDVIDLLLKRGANINAQRFDGARPIHLINGDYNFRGWRDVNSAEAASVSETLAYLIKRGAELDLNMAIYLGDIDLVRTMLIRDPAAANTMSEYVTYYCGSGSPLKNAAARGHLEIVKLLLEHGADPNQAEPGIAPHGQALYEAVANSHYEIAQLLLERGAYPSPEVESSADALCRAVMNNDQKMIEILCSFGSASKVHLLAYYGDIKTAAAVFAVKPELANDPEALANAAGEGQESFVRLMLRYYPDLPKRVIFPGWSVGSKTESINKLLFDHGLDPSKRNWLEITPLHYLAAKGDIDTARQFLSRGADVHAIDDDLKSTPLGWAAKNGQLAMCEFLLDAGATVELPDQPDWARPSNWAKRKGHSNVLQLLAARG